MFGPVSNSRIVALKILAELLREMALPTSHEASREDCNQEIDKFEHAY